MSNIPEFKFDFDAVDGQPFEEATVSLFKQLQDHYNKHIKPAPILFGGRSVGRPSVEFQSTPAGPNPFAQEYPSTPAEAAKVPEGKLIRIEPGYEIKNGKDLGLKEGKILSGVRSDTKVEVFEHLKNYTEGDQIVEGDSGKYDLGRK